MLKACRACTRKELICATASLCSACRCFETFSIRSAVASMRCFACAVSVGVAVESSAESCPMRAVPGAAEAAPPAASPVVAGCVSAAAAGSGSPLGVTRWRRTFALCFLGGAAAGCGAAGVVGWDSASFTGASVSGGMAGMVFTTGAWACGGGSARCGLRRQPAIENVSRNETKNKRQYRILPLHFFDASIFISTSINPRCTCQPSRHLC